MRDRLRRTKSGSASLPKKFMLRPAGKKHCVTADTKHAHRVKFENVRAIASEPTGTVPLFLRSAKDRFARVT